MEQKEILLDMELSVEGNRHIVGLNGCYFQIGEVLFEVLRCRRQEYSWEKIAALVESRFKKNIPIEELKELFQRKIADIIESATKKRKSYIYFKLNFLSESAIENFTRFFTVLFKKKVFYTMGLLSVAITLYYFLFRLNFGALIESADIQLAKLGTAVVLLYLASISIMIFHELGHATASRHFGIRSSSIGFGFYLIFPVFFTDVSKIWTLKVKDRIVVNLGGVYFQFLVNIVLITLSLSLMSNFPNLKLATDLLIISNTFIVLASLNPFLRNDGYWIFCDYFKIYNLMEKVMVGPTNFFKKYYSRNEFSKEKLPVMIYGTINYFIFGFIGFLIIKNLHNSFFKITDLTYSQGFFKHFTVEKFFQLFKVLFSLIICSIYIIKVFKMLLRKVIFTANPDHT